MIDSLNACGGEGNFCMFIYFAENDMRLFHQMYLASFKKGMTKCFEVIKDHNIELNTYMTLDGNRTF